jgi:L-serine dehydratase
MVAPSNSVCDVLSGIENHNAGEKKLNNSFSRWWNRVFSRKDQPYQLLWAVAKQRRFSSMAAAALCEVLGGTPEQVLMAAEIAWNTI